MLALNDGEVTTLMKVFGGVYDVEIPGGRVRLLGRDLPGAAVCAILPDIGDGLFRVVYDPGKPDAFRHVKAMVRDWWESFLVPEMYPDGTVEFMKRICPQPAEEPVRLIVAPREPVD